MQGKIFLQSIELKNILSYGSEGVRLDLQPLNVLIGPNGSGKSNLIEAISLLKAAPRDITKPFHKGTGVEEWIWDGVGSTENAAITAHVNIGPATRLSDGTLRYLCLLTILCHPEPPPLICLEEPELGLHPDILPKLANLLIEASERTQLIVTTHSDLLVYALGEVPEAIVVCERDENGTHLRRLDKERMQKWLENSSLGKIWLSGEIGGTRW